MRPLRQAVLDWLRGFFRLGHQTWAFPQGLTPKMNPFDEIDAESCVEIFPFGLMRLDRRARKEFPGCVPRAILVGDFGGGLDSTRRDLVTLYEIPGDYDNVVFGWVPVYEHEDQDCEVKRMELRPRAEVFRELRWNPMGVTR